MASVRTGGRWCLLMAASAWLAGASAGAGAEAGKGPGQGAGESDPKVPAPALPGRPARSVSAPTLDAAGVDALLAESLAEAKATPAPPAAEEEFLRRVYLDVAGVLPTPQQIREFRRSSAPDKRARLIESLVDGPEAARNWARYWRDVIKFRATNINGNQVRYPALEDWLAQQYEKHAPWDEVATSLITATGIIEEDGATVLAAAHEAKPVEMAGEAARIFLGMQIQCAECHDHPTDPWKREQFHQFAAFFAGTRIQQVNKMTPAEKVAAKDAKVAAKEAKAEAKGEKAEGKEDKAKAEGKEDKAKTEGKEDKAKAEKPKVVKQAPRVFQITMKGVPKYAMPDKADPQKSIPVEPRFFLAADDAPALPAKLTAERRHQLIASYITGQDNPWFAKAFVNRTWGLLLGEGFVNPVDDMGPTRTASSPAVLDALADQFRAGGYDVRWLYTTILNTKAYQREFRPAGSSAGKVPFAANVPGRLRSDQVLDILSQALDTPMDKPRAGSAKSAGEKGMPKLAAFLRNNPRNVFNTLFGVDPSVPVEDVTGTIPQALFLMNGAPVNRAIEARPGSILGQILATHTDNKSALETLYLRVLARRPSTREIDVCDRHLAACHGDRKACFEDILWSLVNTTEFLSRR